MAGVGMGTRLGGSRWLGTTAVVLALKSVNLSAASVVENSAENTVIGAVLNTTPGSTLSLVDNAGGRFKLVGGNIVAGATATNFEAGSTHTITLRETLVGYVNSPRDTTITITVGNQFEQPALGALSLAGSGMVFGSSSSGTIAGATAGSTITAVGLPTGLTIDGAARTWSYDGTGASGSYSFDLIETLGDSANSPRVSNVTIVVSVGTPAANYTVTNDDELAAALSAATSGQIIQLQDSGTFSARANATGKSGITIRAQTRRVPLLPNGIDLTNATNVTVSGIRCVRLAPNDTSSYTNSHVVETGGGTGLSIDDCEVSSNPMSSIKMQVYGPTAAPVSSTLHFQGYSGIGDANGVTTNTTISNCYIHDCFRGINWAVSGTCTATRNTILDCYQNPCESGCGSAGAILNFTHNDYMGTWANPNDPGNPHSSNLGFSAGLVWGAINVIGNKLIAAVGRRHSLSTTDATPTYAAASGPKFNDPTPSNGMNYGTVTFAYNIITAQDGIGLEASFGSMRVFYNTMIKDNLTAGTLTPVLNYHDLGSGSFAAKNIFPGYGLGASNVNGIHPDFIPNSWDNVNAAPAGLGVVVSGDLNCYDFHFNGPTFSGYNLDNIVSIFTPKPTSYFTTDGIGAIGTGYDWSTRADVVLPTLTKPKTTNALGTTPALTQFDGTNDWMQLTGSAPLLGMTNRRALTIIFNATYDGADNLDRYYTESNGTDFSVRKLPNSGRIRYRFKNNANAAICEIDSSAIITQLAANGSNPALRTFLFSVNMTTGRYFIMRGNELDPFPGVTQLKNDDIVNTRSQMAVMGQNDTSPPTGTGLINGRLGLFYMTDEFINLAVAANHNSIVATDGTPADWGADGSAVTGTQPRGFIKGNAAALSPTPTGINLGSSSQKFVLTGAITDA